MTAYSAKTKMLELHKSCMRHIEQATADLDSSVQGILHLEADVATWLDALEEQPEVQQLRSAHQDFGLAFYSAMSGLYRQSFSSLRSFLEVTVGAVYLSSLEFRRRQWVSGKLEISWSSITSSEEGIYSRAFLDEFCPEAIQDGVKMGSDLKTSYRRCSEFIHGKVSTSALLPVSISYSSEILKEWISVARITLLSVMHCFMVRYYKGFSNTVRLTVEGFLEENFSHLDSVRALLDLPREDRK